jgi:hypothetical protein
LFFQEKKYAGITRQANSAYRNRVKCLSRTGGDKQAHHAYSSYPAKGSKGHHGSPMAFFIWPIIWAIVVTLSVL